MLIVREAARKRTVLLALFFSVAWIMTGCAVRSREKITAGTPAAPVLKSATLSDLLAKMKSQEETIQTVDATADIEPSVSSPAKGEIVHYRDVRAFLLIRRPGFIRMIGLYPVVQNKAFDMASDGEDFKVYIPAKNRFIIGKNYKEGQRSDSAIENLRPQHILDALLPKGPDEKTEQAVLEVFQQGTQNFYIVHVIRVQPGQTPMLMRNLWFDRSDLSLSRLQIFDEHGDAVTQATYSHYADFAGVSFPQDIVVDRPKDLYGLRLSFTKLQFNQQLSDDRFKLEQPAGTEVKDIGSLMPQRGFGIG